MEDYFNRLSWEIVRACQYHLPLEIIFAPIGERPLTASMSKFSRSFSQDADKSKESPIEKVIKCCEKWKKCYNDVLNFTYFLFSILC